jgi:hypothetical protein
MQQQKAALQVDQQVFTPAAHTQHLLAIQRRWRAAQRPAQGLAHAHRLNARTCNAQGKALACHFDFG